MVVVELPVVAVPVPPVVVATPDPVEPFAAVERPEVAPPWLVDVAPVVAERPVEPRLPDVAAALVVATVPAVVDVAAVAAVPLALEVEAALELAPAGPPAPPLAEQPASQRVISANRVDMGHASGAFCGPTGLNDPARGFEKATSARLENAGQPQGALESNRNA